MSLECILKDFTTKRDLMEITNSDNLRHYRIDYGFFESKERKEFCAIHLDSGFAAVTFESKGKGYRQKQGFKVLFEKVKALPLSKVEKILPNIRKQIEKAGLTCPVND
jgi:hypothetical protein